MQSVVFIIRGEAAPNLLPITSYLLLPKAPRTYRPWGFVSPVRKRTGEKPLILLGFAQFFFTN